MPQKFIVYAPPYDENSGGAIALHKLCHLINVSGGKSVLHPPSPSFILHAYNHHNALKFADAIRRSLAPRPFKRNPMLMSRIVRPEASFRAPADCCVIYPETVLGNPLRARNVVRWLLHNPGFHTAQIHYGRGELYFRYSDVLEDFQLTGSRTSREFLTVTHVPLESYGPADEGAPRSGSAYCIRKGKGRPLVHDTTNSTLIDGKSHREIGEIFRRVEIFYSYDTETAYSSYAALCGCDSVVIPQPGIPIEQWRPTEADRAGIAYGLDDLERARQTRGQVADRLMELERNSLESVRAFMREVKDYFGIGYE